MKKYFHLYSYGAKTPDLFVTVADFTDAVNLIAVLSIRYGVEVAAFCVQDTHLHILLFGEPGNCLLYRKEMQRLIRRRYGDAFELEMGPVKDSEHLKKVGTYVICQATKDGKRVMPYDYPWSSASLYFRNGVRDALWRYDKDGVPCKILNMSEIGSRNQRVLFHTRNRLTDNWKVCDGMILPSSFVNFSRFENIYQTHNTFRTFLGLSKKADTEILDSMSECSGVNLEESEARIVASERCRDMFGFSDVRRLRTDQRIALARVLRKEYRMGLAQISRRVHLPEIEIRMHLD